MDLSIATSQLLRSELPEAVAIQSLRKVLDLQTQENALLIQLIEQAGSDPSRLNLLA